MRPLLRSPVLANLARVGRACFPYLVFFLVMLAITLPQGAATLVTGAQVPLDTWSATAVEAFGSSDSGSLLGAAISIRDNHLLLGGEFWVYNFWPPGMVVVDLLLLGLESALSIPIVLLMVLLNTALWAAFFGVFYGVIRRKFGFIAAAVFSAGALMSSAVSDWGAGGGIFYSDSFGAIAFCFGILFLILLPQQSTRRRKLIYAILSGVLLATSAYFRASFEPIIDATLLFSIVVLVALLLARRFGRTGRLTTVLLPSTTALALASAAAQVLLTPWRLYAGLRIRPGDFRWSAVSDLASSARWIPTSVLKENGIYFGLNGHSNWACIDDLAQCKRIYALEGHSAAPYTGHGHFTTAQFDQFTLNSFLSHPLTFIAERLDALSFGFLSKTGAAVKDYAMAESLLLIAILVAAVIVLARSRKLTNPGYLLFIFATGIQFATLTLLHMETRYFLGIELGIMAVGAYALAELVKGRPRRPLDLATESPHAKSEQLSKDHTS